MMHLKGFPQSTRAWAVGLLLGAASFCATGGEHVGGTTGAGAEAPTGAVQPSTVQVSEGDRQIMREIAQANLTEIHASRLALERAQDQEVRQFAQRMIEDHTRLHERLADLARVKNVQLPDTPAREQQQMIERLGKLQGAQFDRAYREQIGEQAHEKTHDMMRRSITRAEDPQLMALITQALPVIENHLADAEQMHGHASRTGATGGTEPAAATGGANGGNTSTQEPVSGTAGDTGTPR